MNNIFTGIKTLIDDLGGVDDDILNSPIYEVSPEGKKIIRYIYHRGVIIIDKENEDNYNVSTIDELINLGLISHTHDALYNTITIDLTHKGKHFLMSDELNTHEYKWVEKDYDGDPKNTYYSKTIDIGRDKKGRKQFLKCYVTPIELGKEYTIEIRNQEYTQLLWEHVCDTDENVFRKAEKRLKEYYIPIKVDLLDFTDYK